MLCSVLTRQLIWFTLSLVIKEVKIGKGLAKSIRRFRIPENILVSFRLWVSKVETDGIEEVRKVPGYHDEPLAGDRAGQRSFRLSRGWRGFYLTFEVHLEVIEINHHDY